MEKQNWQRAIEPAPQQFHHAVAYALKSKEEHTMKRAIPRIVIIACALVFALGGVAVANEIGLLDFLHLDSMGTVKSVIPTFHSLNEGEDVYPLCPGIREAATDGISAHIVVAYETGNAGDALLMDFDEGKENIDFAAERAQYDRVMLLNTHEVMAGEEYLTTGIQWRYESAQVIVVDYSVDLRSLDAMPETLTLSFCPMVYAANKEQAPISRVGFELAFPAQTAQKEQWKAAEIPQTGANWKIHQITLTRTDMACYLDVEAEDDMDMAEYDRLFGADFEGGSEEMAQVLPLHGNLWLDVLDENGQPYARLNGGVKLELGEEDEWQHQLIRINLQRFEVGDSLTLRSYDSGTGTVYDAITVKIQSAD